MGVEPVEWGECVMWGGACEVGVERVKWGWSM